jgi:methionine biosynthesis protein MetW
VSATVAPDARDTGLNSGRIDLRLICELVERGTSVLDLGCGDGELMELLIREREVTARGVEISEEGIYRCITRGLSVHHGDLDEGLDDYPDESFDYVILSQTLQAVRKPRLVLQEMLRVGRLGILTFPNFANWHARLDLGLRGRMPVTDDLPHEWFDTPNIHLTTIKDFLRLCRQDGIVVERATYLSGDRRVTLLPNLLARTALFVVKKHPGAA